MDKCIILEIVNLGFDRVRGGNVGVDVVEEVEVLWIKVERGLEGGGMYVVGLVVGEEGVVMRERGE